MILADVDTGFAIALWIGLGLGVLVLGVVVALLNRLIRSALEIERYAKRTLDAGLAIARNVDGVDELARTRQAAGALAERASAYAGRPEQGAA